MRASAFRREGSTGSEHGRTHRRFAGSGHQRTTATRPAGQTQCCRRARSVVAAVGTALRTAGWANQTAGRMRQAYSFTKQNQKQRKHCKQTTLLSLPATQGARCLDGARPAATHASQLQRRNAGRHALLLEQPAAKQTSNQKLCTRSPPARAEAGLRSGWGGAKGVRARWRQRWASSCTRPA